MENGNYPWIEWIFARFVRCAGIIPGEFAVSIGWRQCGGGGRKNRSSSSIRHGPSSFRHSIVASHWLCSSGNNQPQAERPAPGQRAAGRRATKTESLQASWTSNSASPAELRYGQGQFCGTVTNSTLLLGPAERQMGLGACHRGCKVGFWVGKTLPAPTVIYNGKIGIIRRLELPSDWPVVWSGKVAIGRNRREGSSQRRLSKSGPGGGTLLMLRSLDSGLWFVKEREPAKATNITI
ncbi:hypothetical protein PAAG_03749 [Paracoccidioides lutzii Pb01]|uniref:Uncharacterized protein n=1 Tax=Paracoccidioides lutzii (strain ATCC MYA-826 / Pb01) TaxID=502779 RepID=C1GZ05_PARBA|nr:hypothetical protein PAAG_03749 [Paracoccidioides lutzii Pb01]EEH41828.2 hypothetical protein PAAG_03749 [Paracoccidioides lutzii Pb01]